MIWLGDDKAGLIFNMGERTEAQSDAQCPTDSRTAGKLLSWQRKAHPHLGLGRKGW